MKIQQALDFKYIHVTTPQSHAEHMPSTPYPMARHVAGDPSIPGTDQDSAHSKLQNAADDSSDPGIRPAPHTPYSAVHCSHPTNLSDLSTYCAPHTPHAARTMAHRQPQHMPHNTHPTPWCAAAIPATLTHVHHHIHFMMQSAIVVPATLAHTANHTPHAMA